MLKPNNTGWTLLETLISLTIFTILILLALTSFSRIMASIRLNIAAAQLSQAWKITRFDAIGSGKTPTSLCMQETRPQQIEYAQIVGRDCANVNNWVSLTRGVQIDVDNSTLRTVRNIAGNGGSIYRVSWADTKGGLGGSSGQLGRLVLMADGTKAKKCLFLFRTDGSWNIREDAQCLKNKK